ncbi:MAG: thiol reductant ABC exporter subunit CydD [Thalassovita sp.]
MTHSKNTNTPADRLGRFGSILSVAASLVWVLQAWIVASVFSSLLLGSEIAVWTLALAVFILGVFRAALNRGAQKLLSAAAESKIQTLRHNIIATEATTRDPSQIGGAGAIGALTTEKLDALRPYLLRYMPARMRVMTVPLVILAITAWNSWAAAIVLLAAGPLIPLFMALVGWAAKEASAKQMVEIGSLNDLLADRLAALSDLKLVGAGPQVIDGFAVASDGLRHRTMAVLRIAFLSSTVLELFSALGVAMIAVWVGFALLGELSWGAWGAPLTPFSGIFMLLLAPDFFQPLRDLAAAWHDKSAADAVLEELDEWEADDRQPILGLGRRTAGDDFRGLTTRNLSIERNGSPLSFPDLDIQPGDSIALTGPSGAGKSTLLRILAGLETQSRGTVQIGGAPLTDANADAWRTTLGWMPQTPHFLNRSLRYNVGFGQPLSTDILTKAHVAPILETVPSGDLTQLGESGAGLSGGEARRVMLARALHHRPSVVFADEPTADLDAATAQEIIDGLLAYVDQGGTLIAATHDPRLMSQMQRRIKVGGRP